jgi:2-(1,2-epoxy-1,2-dihydrophenyl)acetyl-CoA isomerase
METVLVERSNHVVTVTLNRPEKKNAINDVMWGDLLDAFQDVERRPEDRVMVLTGSGGAFCSGADLTGSGSSGAGPLAGMRRVGRVALALHRLHKPTIAKVEGVAAGAGCNMALACDLIVASEEARFSEIFARRGLSIDFGGSWLLPRLVGLHKAKELALFADVISAREAAEFGIVNRVVPSGELDAFVGDWAARLTAGPPIALSLTKSMLNNGFNVSFEQAVEDEARSQTVNVGTADAAEALEAFIQKRPPRFEGR